jgi:DnaJ-class molecular chaperone
MPIYGNEIKHGDLFVTYTVQFPASLTAEQTAAIKELL